MRQKLSNIYYRFFRYFKAQPKEIHAWEELEPDRNPYHGLSTTEMVIKVMLGR
jgi:hypothetical protein